MKPITSRENPRYKELRLLASSAAARRKTLNALLDGVHLCAAYLEHVGMPLLCVASESGLAHAEVAPLVARCESGGVSCVLLPDSLYQGLSQVEHGIGLLFVIAPPQAAMPPRLQDSAVLLDGLQDPGNLGSILRSAAAAGIHHVLCGSGTASAWSPKVLRAGMGAHFLLNIVENVDLAQAIGMADVPVIATSSHATHRLYEADLARPLAWLFGNEGRGVSPDLLSRASVQVSIPHRGAVESLNVAACAAICMFEQMRQQTT